MTKSHQKGRNRPERAEKFTEGVKISRIPVEKKRKIWYIIMLGIT